MSGTRNNILKTTRRWGVKTLATLLDHGIVSVSNFLVSIVLARIVSESDYGYFAIAFSFFLFFSGLSQAFILEPLNVLGTLKYT
jgi:O-antigen/teichoic acid export membrane protein